METTPPSHYKHNSSKLGLVYVTPFSLSLVTSLSGWRIWDLLPDLRLLQAHTPLALKQASCFPNKRAFWIRGPPRSYPSSSAHQCTLVSPLTDPYAFPNHGKTLLQTLLISTSLPLKKPSIRWSNYLFILGLHLLQSLESSGASLPLAIASILPSLSSQTEQSPFCPNASFSEQVSMQTLRMFFQFKVQCTLIKKGLCSESLSGARNPNA